MFCFLFHKQGIVPALPQSQLLSPVIQSTQIKYTGIHPIVLHLAKRHTSFGQWLYLSVLSQCIQSLNLFHSRGRILTCLFESVLIFHKGVPCFHLLHHGSCYLRGKIFMKKHTCHWKNKGRVLPQYQSLNSEVPLVLWHRKYHE